MRAASRRPDTYPKMLRLNAREHGNEIALREKDLGLWRPFTWNDYNTRVRDFALGMVELGLGAATSSASSATTGRTGSRPKIATHAIGGMSLGLYRDVLDEEAAYLLSYGEASWSSPRTRSRSTSCSRSADRVPT
jgi:long-chain acyl-CoA synthetase